MQLVPAQAPSETEDLTSPDNPTGLSPKWELKQLSARHKQVAALTAQGMKNTEIGAIVGMTPEYVSLLLRQPLMKQYIHEMCEVVGVRMEALFEQSVEVIADAMKSGSHGDKLKAARLQLEATKRIGRVDPNTGGNASNVDRLEQLAERLLGLQSNVRKGRVFNEDGQEISEAELVEPACNRPHPSPEEVGYGQAASNQPD